MENSWDIRTGDESSPESPGGDIADPSEDKPVTRTIEARESFDPLRSFVDESSNCSTISFTVPNKGVVHLQPVGTCNITLNKRAKKKANGTGG